MAATSKGNCYLCGASLGKTAMKNHLVEFHKEDKGEQLCCLLKAEGAYDKDYWLYFDVPVDKTLSAVDGFLRMIWLECCGHLSEFCFPGNINIAPSRKLKNFAVGEKLFHQYDFGTTTETVLTIVGNTARKQQKDIVRLMARNTPPVFNCEKCGKPAKYICVLYVEPFENQYYCEECSEEAEDDDHVMLPVTNSPRMGECAYVGESDNFAFDPVSVNQKQAALPPNPIKIRKESKMNVLIENRRSIRKYQSDKPVTKEQLKQLLEAAMLAPSAHNSRPWEFIAVTRREILDEIARIHPHAKMCETATAAIIVAAIPQKDKIEGFFPQDCGAATQNILLEAVSMGLGACWCGVYPKEELIASFRKLLNISEPKIPFNVIAIGKPAENPARKGFFEESKVTYIE